jgi:hypothetical protein
MVTGLEVLLASVGCREAHVDAFVDATKDTMSDYLFHANIIHPLVVRDKFYTKSRSNKCWGILHQV